MPAEKKWNSIKPLGVYKPEADDEAIIFNPQSGETHLVNLFAFDIIEFLEQPATLSALSTYLCELYQAENPDNLNRQFMPIIAQLDDLGLIYASCA